MRHQRSTQLAGVEDLLHLDVVRVKAAHEADLQQTLAGSLLRLYDLLRVLKGGSQRLLAEYRLAGFDALYCQISMRASQDAITTASISGEAISSSALAITFAP